MDIFLDDNIITMSKTIFYQQNYPVLNLQMHEGYCIMLNREYLFALQDLERVIFESVAIKTTTSKLNLLYFTDSYRGQSR